MRRILLACLLATLLSGHGLAQGQLQGGGATLRVQPGKVVALNDVVPLDAGVGGCQGVTYLWTLVRPRAFPRGVTFGYHAHQDPREWTSVTTPVGTSGFVEASYHSTWAVINKSKVELVLHVRYVAWPGC